MSTTSSARRGQFWRTDWFVGVLVVAATMVLQYSTDLVSGLERRFYDYASTVTARQPSDRVAIIAIDDYSIGNIGQWPWRRDVHAELIDKLAAGKAKTIVEMVNFAEPQSDRGLAYIRKIQDALAPARGRPAAVAEANKLIRQADDALDYDARLAASIAKAGNVLVPSFFTLGKPVGKPDRPLTAAALRSSLDDTQAFAIESVSTTQPIEAIANAAAGIGQLNLLNDVDGAVRSNPLMIDYYGKAIPSLALLAAARSLNLSISDIKLRPGNSVQLGKLRLPTDGAARLLPQFYRPRADGKSAFTIDSFYDVLTGKIPASKYADKIVLIGATAQGVGTQVPAPGYAAVTPVEMLAHVTSSILKEHYIVVPGWGTWAALGVFLLVAGYVIAVLPRLSAGMGGALTALLFLALLGTEFGLLSGAAIRLQFVFPAALLLIGHVALTTKRFLVTEAGKVRADEESAETNRMMGLALQGQGQFDMAFDRFQRVPMNDEVMANLYNLALDFERKRQFNKAEAVYAHMARYNPRYKDLDAKLKRAQTLSQTLILGGATRSADTLVLHGAGVEQPMLGRYRLEKELGKGAMGVVYQGRDPKIGRVVAIKTLALSQEFEGEELEDARARFFREAETAGRLQHQNIVTIFDAGEEHDLAYIAMEFLQGRDLVDHCKDGNLLPAALVLSIVARVAEALAYAHRQHVVHRDIKPANIMYERDSDTVKVTDFGIARITDASRTRTGMVLGTPSFMSPEQLAGRKVDGRSDLWSLGITLYQMLTGALPFRGESIAQLMYKIANEDAPDLRLVRHDLPHRLAQVVARALTRQPDLRYQDGDAFARDLRAVLASLPAEPGAPRRVAVSSALGDGRHPSAAAAAQSAAATVESAPVMAAGNALPALVTRAASRGYDATQKVELALATPFDKTTVMNKTGAPERPQAGARNTGQEP